MAPRPRDPPPATPGLLASAFSFVTRELESFVTAATGREVQPKHEDPQPEASSSRVTLDGRRRERGEGRTERENERRGKRVRKRSEVESERARARRRVRAADEGSDDDGDRALRAMKRKVLPPPKPQSRSSEREAADDEDDDPPPRPAPTKPAKKRRNTVEETVLEPEPIEDVAEGVPEPEPSPAPAPPKKKSSRKVDKPTGPTELMPPPQTPMRPPPPPAQLLKTPAPTMPGSLFPRSSSMMPEATPANYQRAVPRLRTPTPPPPAIAEEEKEGRDDDDDDDELGDKAEQPTQRGRSTDRVAEEPRHKSASAVRSTSVRESSRHSESSGRAASSSRRSLDEHAEPPAPQPRSYKGKERAWDTSSEVRVRGKERELREATEEYARNAHERDDGERERDKLRIRLLEEEVARLRAELALKSSGSMLPPPPPPPPPPPLFRPQAATIATDGTGSYLASARACLKPTAPPVEAPINGAAYGGARAKRSGQPTVNVPSDKMAAFLREMKNVRLRRVAGLSGNTSMGPPASTAAGVEAELNRSTSTGGMSRARIAATLGERSFDLGVATRMEIGQKRKRERSEELVAGPSKRRETTFLRSNETGASSSASSSQSVASSSQSSASSSQTSLSSSDRPSGSKVTLFEMAPPRSQPSRPRTNAPLRIWPTSSTAETDLTTPSLCSDNENDHEHEDKAPTTPSDSGRGGTEAKTIILRQRQPQPQGEPEIIDVDAMDTPPSRAPALKSAATDKKDLFARRAPVSPLPGKSPAKPAPPARAAKSKTGSSSRIPLALPRRVPRHEPETAQQAADGSESDDPLAAAVPPSRPESRGRGGSREEAPRPGPSRMRRDSSSSSPSVRSPPCSRDAAPETRMAGRLSNHARRRLTLDEELRRAGDSLWQPSDEEAGDGASGEEEEEEEPDVDSGELVAFGTRSSKRGFLARGGGAGAPVFMGEGYVPGAVDEDRPAGRSRSGTGESSRRSRR